MWSRRQARSLGGMGRTSASPQVGGRRWGARFGRSALVVVGSVAALAVSTASPAASWAASPPVKKTASPAKIPTGFPAIVPLPAGTFLPGTGKVGSTFELVIAVKGPVVGVTRAYAAHLGAVGFKAAAHDTGKSNWLSASGKGWMVTAAVKSGVADKTLSVPGDSIVSIEVYKG